MKFLLYGNKDYCVCVCMKSWCPREYVGEVGFSIAHLVAQIWPNEDFVLYAPPLLMTHYHSWKMLDGSPLYKAVN